MPYKLAYIYTLAIIDCKAYFAWLITLKSFF